MTVVAPNERVRGDFLNNLCTAFPLNQATMEAADNNQTILTIKTDQYYWELPKEIVDYLENLGLEVIDKIKVVREWETNQPNAVDSIQ